MTSRTIIYLVFLLAGAVLGAVARGAISPDEQRAGRRADAPRVADFQRPDAGDQEAIVEMLESLSYALNQESEYRQTLEEQIAGLEDRIDALQERLAAAPAGNGASSDIAAKIRENQRGRAGLTMQGLLEAGLDQRDAQMIKRRVDDLSMQRLYLRDQAMREGWLGEPRYREEARRIANEQNNLRSEFGDDNYDRYLYASGRPNRIQIQSVIEDSPAFSAGLRPEDRIVSYGGDRTYAPGDLRRFSMGGEAGEMVALQVERNGRRLDLYIPRGPLGVQMTGISEKPAGE